MRQQDLEQEMHELGISRYWKKVERSTQNEMETNHPLGRRLLTESVGLLASAITAWKNGVEKHPTGNRHRAYAYINFLDPALVAAITARTVLDAISMNRQLTKTANTVARMLEDEVRWREMREKHPDIWRHNAKQIKKIPGYETKRRYLQNSERYVELQFDKWPRTDKLKVGVVLVELMRSATGIIDIETRTGLMGKTYTYVRPTDDLVDWMKKAHKYSEDLSPIFLPMIEPPEDWQDVYSGGYKTDFVAPRPMVKTQDKTHLDDLNGLGLEEPRAALNHLQRVPWRINSSLFRVLEHCWEQGVEVGDLPSPTDELIPSKPIDIETNLEARRRWRKAAARIRFENSACQSKRLQVSKVLWMGRKFLNRLLWFPWYMDFRSRMYPRPYFLQPQGPDWSRAMLMAAHGKAIETEDAENALAIQGANTWGEDKVSLEGRIQWTHDHREMIESIAKDPEGSVSVWGKADKPWAFLGFCQEWAGYLQQGRGYISHLPCSIDGASNGLQLYSLLMRDPGGAEATNVLPTDTPNDIYGDVSSRAILRMETAAADGNPLAKTWLKFGIDRTCSKRPTMVVPYSGTRYACRIYIMDWFRDQLKKRAEDNPFGWEELYTPCNYLSGVVWDSIGDVVGEARKAMAWLQEVSDICIDNGVPPRWSTPTGFVVKQAYETWQRQSVRTIIGDVIRQHRIRVGTGRLDRRKARNGIAPNFIHSIDGSIGQRTICRVVHRGVDFISAVHDDYAVLAADMEILQHELVNTVADIFSTNLLEQFSKDIQHFLPKEVVLPEIPPLGDLDVNLVRQSRLMFA